MLVDEDNAGAALPGCGRLWAVRPGASVQSVPTLRSLLAASTKDLMQIISR